MTATYRALVPIALHTHVCEAGTILVEGENVAVGWVPPSGDCDPLTPDAVLKYYATVPRLPPAVRGVSPKTAWQVVHYPSHDEWRLCGLGASLDPICM
jgi:hypothetical protein